MSDQPVPRIARARVALKIGAAVASGAVALAIVLHAPIVRRAALRYALTAVQRDFGLTLDAARLDYNLVALRVGLAGIRLSTPGSANEPFFEADYVSVTLPIGALFGDVALNDITVTNARAVVHRRTDGTTNLPRTEGGGEADPPAIRVGRLDVPRLAIDVRDEQANVALQVPAIAFLLTPTEGSVSLGMPAELRVGARATRIPELRGEAAFDGRTLRLSDASLRTNEASLTLEGAFLLIARDPRIDLRVSGTGDIARLARWGLGDEELPQGDVAFNGTVSGPIRAPQAQLEIAAERASWRGVNAARLTARVHVSTEAADVQELRAGFADGTVTTAALFPFAPGATSRATASWTRVNAALAASAVAPDAGLVPSGLASGQLSVAGILSDASTWSGSLRLQMAPGRNARGRIAVAGNLALEWRDGTWRLEGQPTLAGVAPIRVEARGRFGSGPPSLRAPGALRPGRAEAERRREGPPLQQAIAAGAIEGAVRLGETDLPALLAALRTTGLADITSDAVAAGTLVADVDLGGSLADPSVSGDVTGRNLAGPQFILESVSARVSGRPLQPRLDFSIAAPEAGVAGQRLNDVRAMGRLTDEAGPLPPSPGLRRTSPGTRPTETAPGTTAGMSLVFDSLSARQPGGPGVVTGSGAYDLSTGEYTASIDGAEWSLAADADQPLGGRLTIHFTGFGTAEEPGGTGQVTLADAKWRDVLLGDLAASVQLDGQAALVQAEAQDFVARATARIQLDAPHGAVINARASLDLARVLRDKSLADTPVAAPAETPRPMTVGAGFDLRFEGPLDAWRTGSALLEVASLDAVVGTLPIQLAQPARLRYEAERVVVDSFEVDADGTPISVAGELEAFEPARETALNRSAAGVQAPLPGLLVTLTGDLGEVARAAAATGLAEVPITGGGGPVALLARITGSLQAPIVAADLEVGPGSVTLRDLPPLSGLRLRSHAENGWIELREGAASYQDADITVTGRAPLSWVTPAVGATGDAVLHARATNVTPAILSPFLDQSTIEQISGSVDANVDVESASPDLSAVTGEVRIDRLDVRVADLPVTQRVPTRIALRDGFARVEAWDWVGQGATLAVRGQVRLEDRQAAILANGVVDLRMLTPFVRDAGMTAAGRLEPRLSITGALDNPRIDGDLTVTGGEIRLADPRILVSDLGVRAVLTRTSAQVTSLMGTVNGGTLTGSGAVEYSAEGGLDAQLSTSVRGMALEFPTGLRSEVDAALDLDVSGALDVQRPSGRLSGTVTVVRGSYREPLAVVTDLLAGLRAGRLAAGAGGVVGSSPGLLETTTLDVRLITDEDVSVNNNYGRFQIGADLRAIGTAAAPALAGRADLREGGQLFVGRNVYTISAGTIDFTNPVTIEPTLNVKAATRAGGEDIDVTITGPAENPSVELRSTSSPELGQAEVASLLLTGRRLDQLAPGDAAFVGTQVLGNFSAEVLGFAGRAVGLDTLRLGSADTTPVRSDPTAAATELDPTTRLTFGKSLGSGVDLTFSQSLRDGDAQTWIIDYVPTRGLGLRLVSDDNDLRSYAFRHEVGFGGPGRAIRVAGVPGATAQGQIADVRFSGEFVIPEARVRGVLRLSLGDRFDFARWQADRDRLEELYRGEGFLTARVTPTRSDGPDGVTLDYRVVTGPATRILVDGIELSPALRSRIETAWVQSTLDDFLVDEVAQVVRGELARDRYLQPAVDVRVLRENDRTTLSIMVDRGRLAARTMVRVEGADETLAGKITAWLMERGLADAALLNTAAVEREVAGYLRMAGHVRARVTVGGLRFEDNEGGRGKGGGGSGALAVVPVRVDAGPAFSIARVAFDGADRVAANTLREAVGLAESAPYDPAAVDAARDRLVALYRREGFPSATVTARSDIRTAAPVVDVMFVVAEGARQVLGGVIVSGNRAIDPDVIVRALRLPMDTPLKAEDVLQARTRLFDTGLFRRVDVALPSPAPRGGGEPASPEVRGRGPGDSPAGDGRVVPVQLRVTVEEWPALRLRYGFQVAEERPEGEITGRDLAPGLSGDVIRRTLFGRAITLGGAVEVQHRERLGRVFVNTPTTFGLPLGSSLVVERSHRSSVVRKSVTDTSSLSWEQRMRLTGRLTLSYAYRFKRERTIVTSIDPAAPSFDILQNVARLTGSGAWDSRDDPADTARGMLLSSSLEFAPAALGSERRFVRYSGQGYLFRPFRTLVFASAGRFGAVRAFGGQDVFLSERFYAGGSRTIRGVDEDSLGERDFFGPVGGRALLVLNQEIRVPLYRWFRGVGFLDAGNVFPSVGSIDVGSLVGSVGAGLRVATPVGVIRADVARQMWGPADVERSWRWAIGLGQIF